MSQQLCTTENCNGQAKAKGMCISCYKRFWRTGSVARSARSFAHAPLVERFWRYVTQGNEHDCWLWCGHKDKNGYGWLRIKYGQSCAHAHRFSYELHNGSIPDDLFVLHKCPGGGNPSCVNPAHLALGTHKENMADRKAAGHYNVGERHHYAKFSDVTVAAVRAAEGTQKAIAKQFGMSESQVSNIKHGRQRRVLASAFVEDVSA